MRAGPHPAPEGEAAVAAKAALNSDGGRGRGELWLFDLSH
jgi:hypothetical protein